jgi:hypothetical protein
MLEELITSRAGSRRATGGCAAMHNADWHELALPNFAAGLSQRAEASGQIEAHYYSSLFNSQNLYLCLHTLGNLFKFQKFIENPLNIIKIQAKFHYNPLE